ncbi:MAG: leucine-rich repeat domain-containing protein [Promethearchaeota archaeon]
MKNFMNILLNERDYEILKILEKKIGRNIVLLKKNEFQNPNDLYLYEIESGKDEREIEFEIIGQGLLNGINVRDGRIKHLVLVSLELNRFIDEILELKDLTVLDISGNQIDIIPQDISKFKNLKALILERNKLEFLPESINQLENLQYLDLSYNNLKKIPESIGNLKALKKLNLMYNNLNDLPSSIWNLENLEVFNISYNNIELIHDSIGNLKNLQKFNFGYNKISNLPLTLKNLKKLKLLEFNPELKKKFSAEVIQMLNEFERSVGFFYY